MTSRDNKQAHHFRQRSQKQRSNYQVSI